MTHQLTDPKLFARTVADQMIAEHNLIAEYSAKQPNIDVRPSEKWRERDQAIAEIEAATWLAAARIIIEAAGLKWQPRYERVERSPDDVPRRLL